MNYKLFNQELINKCVTDMVTIDFLLNGGVWLVAENPPLCIHYDKKSDRICTYVDYEIVEKSNNYQQRITELESALAKSQELNRIQKGELHIYYKALELCIESLDDCHDLAVLRGYREHLREEYKKGEK